MAARFYCTTDLTAITTVASHSLRCSNSSKTSRTASRKSLRRNGLRSRRTSTRDIRRTRRSSRKSTLQSERKSSATASQTKCAFVIVTTQCILSQPLLSSCLSAVLCRRDICNCSSSRSIVVQALDLKCCVAPYLELRTSLTATPVKWSHFIIQPQRPLILTEIKIKFVA
jgi:hypothetical protein